MIRLTGFSLFLNYLTFAAMVAVGGCYLHNTGAKIVLIVVAVIMVIAGGIDSMISCLDEN